MPISNSVPIPNRQSWVACRWFLTNPKQQDWSMIKYAGVELVNSISKFITPWLWPKTHPSQGRSGVRIFCNKNKKKLNFLRENSKICRGPFFGLAYQESSNPSRDPVPLSRLRLPECELSRMWTLDSPVPEGTKMPIPVSVRYRIMGTQSGTRMLRYQTEIPDSGKPMPVLRYAKKSKIEKECRKKGLNPWKEPELHEKGQ